MREKIRQGHKRIVGVLPTGAGKTVVGSYLVQSSVERDNLTWWLAHRKELIDQPSKTFHDFDIPHSFIRSKYPYREGSMVQIGSIPTVAKRLGKLVRPRLMIMDEGHHIGAATWQSILDDNPDAVVIFLTATPIRLDGQGMGNWATAMVVGPSTRELMDMGYLCDYKMYAPPKQLDLSGIGRQAGDYRKKALADALNKPSITGDAITHYKQICDGEKGIVFCVNVQHSKDTAQRFCEAGVKCEHIDGTMPPALRDAIMRRFRAGETTLLSNVDLFDEGLDVPDVVVVIGLRPSKSMSKILQQWGRALRMFPGKECAYILDHAGNSNATWRDHEGCDQPVGLPDDERQWTLEDGLRRKKSEASTVVTKTCPECLYVYRPAPRCPQCGHSAPVQAREIEVVEGELEEVKRQERVAKKEARMEVGRAETFEELLAIEKERGYKNGWARIRWAQKSKRRN
ncbi:MAG: DEAD/DEAH box helicase [Marinomonas sp.]